jgi:hypothetical protein
MKMIHLVGQQPIPILMAARQWRADANVLVATRVTESVARRVERLLPNASVHMLAADEYNLKAISSEISKISAGDDVVFDITGGTKMMALGVYNIASRRGVPLVYVQSDRKLVLHEYVFNEKGLMNTVHTLGELFTIDEFLLAHLPGYRVEGVHQENGRPSIGGRFEKAVAEILTSAGFEVVSGVRPENVGSQIEIDMVIRYGNRVGVAELKKAFDSSPKTGFDQLSTAASSTYLGTFTTKLLITGSGVSRALREMANETKVVPISLQSYQDGKGFSRTDEQDLVAKVRKALGA